MKYAGVGSRETPPHYLKLIREIARRLALNGWILRSGGAVGADTAFEEGCDQGRGEKEIYLPWRVKGRSGIVLNHPKALELMVRHHHDPKTLTHSGVKLMKRNGYQVLGPNFDDPVDMVVCYTHAGSGAGGTGQAIRIANAHSITVYDLGARSVEENQELWLGTNVVS